MPYTYLCHKEYISCPLHHDGAGSSIHSPSLLPTVLLDEAVPALCWLAWSPVMIQWKKTIGVVEKHLQMFDFIFTSIKNLPIDRPRDSNIFHVHPPPPKLSFDSLLTRPLLVCLVVCKHMTTQKALWAFRQKASTIIESNGANKTYLLPLLHFPHIFCSKFKKYERHQTLL